MLSLLQFVLKILAKIVLWKYKPIVVGITGSVGKSSTKEAIAAVLRPHFRIRVNPRNYNNEIGVPLTILGLTTGGHSVWLWLKNFWRALKLIILPNSYPEILILEMGADKPGDIKYLVDFVPVKIGVVTAIGQFPSHIEFFPEREALINEKANLVKYLPLDGLAILNYDDLSVRMMRELVPSGVRIITYGFGQGAQLRISHYELKSEDLAKGEFGVNFKIEYNGNVVPIRLNQVLGKQQCYAAGAAAVVGLRFGLNLVDISEGLSHYRGLPGRTKLIPGIKNTWIIDDTYNASPSAMIAALEILNQLPGQRKIAILGDMLELGKYTEEAHRRVGEEAAAVVDMLVVVGTRAKFIAEQARVTSLELKEKKKIRLDPDNIFEFETLEEAGLFLQKKIKTDDLILVKASRAMHLEKVVQEIMAHPEKAKDLLVAS